VLPLAREIAPNEFELEVSGVRELNDALAALIARGALLRAVTPSVSSLEREFREAVGESIP